MLRRNTDYMTALTVGRHNCVLSHICAKDRFKKCDTCD